MPLSKQHRAIFGLGIFLLPLSISLLYGIACGKETERNKGFEKQQILGLGKKENTRSFRKTYLAVFNGNVHRITNSIEEISVFGRNVGKR